MMTGIDGQEVAFAIFLLVAGDQTLNRYTPIKILHWP
jgi:hypothetical protein